MKAEQMAVINEYFYCGPVMTSPRVKRRHFRLYISLAIVLSVASVLWNLATLGGHKPGCYRNNVTPFRSNHSSWRAKSIYRKLAGNKSLDPLLDQLEGDRRWDWIMKRIRKLWVDWREAFKILRTKILIKEFRHQRVLVVPGVLSATHIGTAQGIKNGGPLGDLQQWADLIAGLHVLGHDVTLASDVQEADERLLRSGKGFNRSHHPQGKEAFDLVYVDIFAVKRLSFRTRKRFSCYFRVLDAFGTHAAYNDPAYARRHRYASPWGRLGLHLKQFLTFYPHTPDNTFLGFVVPKTSPTHTRKQNIGLLYGKKPHYIKQPHLEPYYKSLARYVKLYATVNNDTGPLPEGITSVGVLSVEQYHHLLDKTKYLVGLGHPLESTGVLEALAHGCIFLNPQMAPHEDVLQSLHKPTSRQMHSQVPYLEDDVGTPRVHTLDPRNSSHVDSVMQRTKHIRLQGYTPHEFTQLGFLERLAIHVEKQSFCGSQQKQDAPSPWPMTPWPPVSAMRVVTGRTNASCTDACRDDGLICEPTFFSLVNSKPVFERHFSCPTLLPDSHLTLPNYDVNQRKCFRQANENLFSCAGAHESHRRLCPCRDFIAEQTALCKDCLP